MIRPDVCPCHEGQPDPCPACGATVKGDDPVNGVCQAKGPPATDYGLRIILIDKRTEEPV